MCAVIFFAKPIALVGTETKKFMACMNISTTSTTFLFLETILTRNETKVDKFQEVLHKYGAFLHKTQ